MQPVVGRSVSEKPFASKYDNSEMEWSDSKNNWSMSDQWMHHFFHTQMHQINWADEITSPLKQQPHYCNIL